MENGKWKMEKHPARGRPGGAPPFFPSSISHPPDPPDVSGDLIVG
jgi:hypothetical protein